MNFKLMVVGFFLLVVALWIGVISLFSLGVQYIWVWYDPNKPMPFSVAFVLTLIVCVIFKNVVNLKKTD